jgi:hypothetical protein
MVSRKKSYPRRELIKTMASASVAPVLIQLNPAAVSASGSSAQPPAPHPQRAGDARPWTPAFFTSHQNEMVTVITELIIPETDTAGAKAAGVNQFIDFILSGESAEVQQRFLRGLDWIDRKSRELFGGSFLDLKPEQQTSILNRMASPKDAVPEDQPGAAFFNDIKERTVFAYYTSEIGIHQELQYKGLSFLDEFPGCRHTGHPGPAPKK